jgi:LPXTG-motif cell wall-anchored protein
MRQRPRRSLTRAAAAGFALTAAGVSTAASLPAFAGQPAPRYSADSSADLIRIAAIDGLPLAVNGRLADVRVAASRCSTSTDRPLKGFAESTHVSATIAGQHASELPRNTASQSAGPDHRSPQLADGPTLNLGLARLGLGRLRAHARWNAGLARPAGPAMLTESAGAIASFTLLPAAGLPVPVPFLGTSAASIHKTGYSQCRNNLVTVAGQTGLGVSASARTSATTITLFGGTPQQHTLRVISPPSLTVVAAGTSRSSVRYIAPIVEVIDVKGNVQRIDAPDQSIDIPLTTVPTLPGGPSPSGGFDLTAIPGVGSALAGKNVLPVPGGLPAGAQSLGTAPALPPIPGTQDLTGTLPTGALGGGGGGAATQAGSAAKPALVRVSLGELVERTSPTSVTADATTIRVDVLTLNASGPLVSMRLGVLHAASTAPADGIQPTGGTVTAESTPDATEAGGPDGETPGGGGDPDGLSGTPNPGSASAAGDPSQPGVGSADSSSLPVTGTSLSLVLAAGVGLVLAGRLAVLVARRRMH